MLIPGFSLFSSALYAYTGLDLNLYLPVLLFISGTLWSWSYISERCWLLAHSHLMSTVRIGTDDEIYNMIMAWVVQQNFSKKSRHIMANTNVNSKNWLLWSYSDSGNEDDDEEENEEERSSYRRDRKSQRALQYTPSYGTHYFWFRNRPMIFDRCDNSDQMSNLTVGEKEEVHITCFGRSPQLLKDLLQEAREMYIDKDETKTLIYRGTSGHQMQEPSWQRCMSRSSRPFSTVILNEAVKQQLIDDVADYLNPATRRWYANRGIPYRRGYLLYGPPGTGKSSLSLALAGHFKMRIYILNLSSPMATEDNVSSLFASLPRKCVVLLEDIDSAGLTHTRDAASPVSGAVAAPPPPPGAGGKPGDAPPPAASRLSLSGLLNILDGVASQEGRVLIMTTNHLDKLDKALIRPGRVDMTVQFGKSDAQMSAAIFRAIYSPYAGEDTPAYAEKTKSKEAADDKAVVSNDEAAAAAKIDDLADAFAKNIPELEFSPAEIQGLLLRHKRDPVAAINSAEEWVVRTRQEKEEKELKEAEERRKKLEEQKAEAEKKAEEEKAEADKKAKEKRKADRRKAKAKAKNKDEDEAGSGKDDLSDSESAEEEESGKAASDETMTEQRVGNVKETKESEEGPEFKKKDGASDSGYGTP
jgi:chaperone BCS1